MKRLHRKSSAGFTLIEILLVIVIIVTLMTVLLGTIRTSMNEAKINTATLYATRIAQEIERYGFSNGNYPSTAQGLRALVERPSGDPIPKKWIQIEEKLELDPWGQEYHYENPGKHNRTSFDVYSGGPDRTVGTDDDIGNW